MLRDEYVGRELAQQRRHHGVERAQPARVAGARREGDVDRTALRVRAAGVGREAGAGEQELSGLVQGDGQHPRVVVEDRLDTVAVVDVDVDVRDPLRAFVEQPPDAHRDVVVDAEAARPARHRVVEPAGDVGAVDALAGPDPAERLLAGTDDVRRRVVHAAEDGVVVGAETAQLLSGSRARAHPPHGVDQRGVVDGGDQVVGRHRGRDLLEAVEHAGLGGEPHRQVDPERAHRVVGPEVVVGQRGVEHHAGAAGARLRHAQQGSRWSRCERGEPRNRCSGCGTLPS